MKSFLLIISLFFAATIANADDANHKLSGKWNLKVIYNLYFHDIEKAKEGEYYLFEDGKLTIVGIDGKPVTYDYTQNGNIFSYDLWFHTEVFEIVEHTKNELILNVYNIEKGAEFVEGIEPVLKMHFER